MTDPPSLPPLYREWVAASNSGVFDNNVVEGDAEFGRMNELIRDRRKLLAPTFRLVGEIISSVSLVEQDLDPLITYILDPSAQARVESVLSGLTARSRIEILRKLFPEDWADGRKLIDYLTEMGKFRNKLAHGTWELFHFKDGRLKFEQTLVTSSIRKGVIIRQRERISEDDLNRKLHTFAALQEAVSMALLEFVVARLGDSEFRSGVKIAWLHEMIHGSTQHVEPYEDIEATLLALFPIDE